MSDPTLSLVEKAYFQESKDIFELEYKRACTEFKEQDIEFKSHWVLVVVAAADTTEKCTCKKYTQCCYYLPRNFTLYSLAQRQLCKKIVQDNNSGYDFIRKRCLRDWEPYTLPCPSWKEPLSMMRMSSMRHSVAALLCRQRIGRSTIGRTPNDVSDVCLEWCRQHDVSVEEDKLVMQTTVSQKLPPLLQEDLFNFLVYYSFEDFIVWGDKPRICPCCIDLDNNYFLYSMSCHKITYVRLGHTLNHKEKKELLVQLPVTTWSP